MPRTKPKSDVGAAMARLNGGLFGFAADAPVIAAFESAEEWTRRYEALVVDTKPVGALEEMLVERAATLFWKLKRVARWESEYSATAIERVPEDFLMRPLNRSLPRTIEEADERVEAAAGGLRLLEGLGGMTVETEISDDAVDCIFEAWANDDADARKLLFASVPGFEEGIGNAGDWSAPTLLLALKSLAERWECGLEDLLAHTVTVLRAMLAVRTEERGAMLAEQDRMRRERMLPEAGTLHAMTRYELGLHRQLMQMLHELEAAQARRHGESAPLLRADLQLVGEQ